MTMVMSFGGGFAAHFGGTAKWNRIVRVLEHNVIVFVCLFVCLVLFFIPFFFLCVSWFVYVLNNQNYLQSQGNLKIILG